MVALRQLVSFSPSHISEKNYFFSTLAWLQDKLTSKFYIPAIYQPASNIPLDIWQAAPSTSNGNEQAHRNINRDGTGLTLLAAIMRGLQYDTRAETSLALKQVTGIYHRDQLSTHFLRIDRAVQRARMFTSFTCANTIAKKYFFISRKSTQKKTHKHR
jgi:hypothetical protein